MESVNETQREDTSQPDAMPDRSEIVRYLPTGESLAVIREPEDVLADAQKAAAALMKVVSGKKKQVTFNGETYLESGDWQTVAKFYGVTAKIEGTNFVQFGDVRGFEAAAVALDCNGREVSRGEAMCLDDEENWGMRPKYEWQDVLDAQGKKIWEPNPNKPGGSRPKSKRVQVGEAPTPLFQLRSMAQTRACSKALSNLFKWVVVLAGYKPTPAEEMIGTVEESREPTTHAQAGPADPNAEPEIRPKSQKGATPPAQAQQAQDAAPAPQREAVQGEVVNEPCISPAQAKRYFAIMRSAGGNDEQSAAQLAALGYHGHRDSMPRSIYNAAVDALDPEMKFHQNKPKE